MLTETFVIIVKTIIELHEAVEKVSTKPIVLYGDFNCRIDNNDSREQELTTALSFMNLHLMNDPQERTYISKNGCSTIDLIFVSE